MAYACNVYLNCNFEFIYFFAWWVDPQCKWIFYFGKKEIFLIYYLNHVTCILHWNQRFIYFLFCVLLICALKHVQRDFLSKWNVWAYNLHVNVQFNDRSNHSLQFLCLFAVRCFSYYSLSFIALCWIIICSC